MDYRKESKIVILELKARIINFNFAKPTSPPYVILGIRELAFNELNI